MYEKNLVLKKNRKLGEIIFSFIFLPCITLFFITFSDLAFALPRGSNIGQVLCIGASFFSGSAGKGIALIGVFIIGVTAFYGKITWGTAILVGIGIAVLFGADALVVALGGFNCHANFAAVAPLTTNG